MKWRKNVFGRLLAPAVMFVLGTSAYGEEKYTVSGIENRF